MEPPNRSPNITETTTSQSVVIDGKRAPLPKNDQIAKHVKHLAAILNEMVPGNELEARKLKQLKVDLIFTCTLKPDPHFPPSRSALDSIKPTEETTIIPYKDGFPVFVHPPNFLAVDGRPLPTPQYKRVAQCANILASTIRRCVPKEGCEQEFNEIKDEFKAVVVKMGPDNSPPLPFPVEVNRYIFSFISPDEQPPIRVINRWCREYVPGRAVTPKFAQLVANRGNTTLLEWIAQYIPVEKRVGLLGLSICKEAAAGGYLNTFQSALRLKFLPSSGICSTAETCNNSKIYAAAARTGQLNVLNWGLAHDCLKGHADAFIWNEAASNRHLQVMRWAHANGLKWSGLGTFVSAAVGGSTDILQFLLDNKCPSSKWICLMAIENGHLDALKWAIEHGIPYDHAELLAKAQNRPAILQWLQELPQTI